MDEKYLVSNIIYDSFDDMKYGLNYLSIIIFRSSPSFIWYQL